MIKSFLRTASIVIIILFLSAPTKAQEFLISQAQITTCSGLLLDSGGPDDPYSDNESFTTTICPNVPGRAAILNWQVFDLSLDGQTSTTDRIELWDGSSTLSTYLGSYTGTELQSLTLSATIFNPTGCLTVRFTSNGSGTGNFTGVITCSGTATPCDSIPTAINSTLLSATEVLCVGDTLFLDGSNSTPFDGTSLVEWRWITGNSTPLISTSAIDTLVITDPGLLGLQLQVVSSSGCSSLPTPVQYVLASGPVHFTGTTNPSAVCYPDAAELVGHATLLPFVHTYSAGGNYGSGSALPDQIAVPLRFTSIISWAEPGSSITSAADLGEICLEMEHSFMGDLIIELKCPNGTEVTLQTQGGGNTFLGDASDDLPNGIPGICWNYCFSASPEHGTWAECVASGVTPNTIPLNSTDAALSPGSYTPSESLNDLIGCPINGTWTLTFYDFWGGDDGSLCSWSLGLPVAYDSSFSAMTGTLDLQNSTLTHWTGTSVVSLPTDPTMASAHIATEGAYEHTFTVIDSYGCTFDTTVTVLGVSMPTVDAGSDITNCTGEAVLGGEVDFGTSDTCTYTLVLLRQTLNGGSGTPNVQVVILNDTTIYTTSTTLWRAFDLVLSDNSPLEITLLNSLSSNHRIQLFDANYDLVFDSGWGVASGILYSASASCTGVIPAFGNITWSPSIGLSDPGSASTTIVSPAAGWYTLTASYLNGCSISDSVSVTDLGGSAALVWNSTDSTLCADQSTSGTYAWYHDGSLFTTTTTPCLSSPPYGSWSLNAVLDGGCSYLSDTLLVCPVLEMEQIGTILQATELPGLYTWYYNDALIPDEEEASILISGPGEYTVTLAMPIGCVLVDTLVVIDPTGIEVQPGDHTLRIIPNPSTGIFHIRVKIGTGKDWTFKLTDLIGRVVYAERWTNDIDGKVLDLGHLAAGTYVLDLSAGGEEYREKLVVEK